MQLFIIDFEVKSRDYYMEDLDSNPEEMNGISRVVFSLAQILLSHVHKECGTCT